MKSLLILIIFFFVLCEDDFYKTLGVKRDSSQSEIRKAYKNLALKYHPDRVEESKKKEAEKKFMKINEAYEILSDEQKRREYDRWGKSAFTNTGGRRGGGGGGGGFTFTFNTGGGGGGFHGFPSFDDILREFEMFETRTEKRTRGSRRKKTTSTSFHSSFSFGGFDDIVNEMFSTNFGGGSQAGEKKEKKSIPKRASTRSSRKKNYRSRGFSS